MVWRLLRDGEHGAAWNMALDQAILDAVADGIAPPTLRIYGWNETAVTVGRFQNAERDVDLQFCSAHGIPVVRRPTGGRGILHGSDVTVSVVVPTTYLSAQKSVAAAYERLTAGFAAAFEAMGMPLERGRCEKPEHRSGDCFQVRSAADLVTPDGSKLIGSAMRRTSGGVLLQTSVRYAKPEVRPADVFLGAAQEEYYPLAHVEDSELREAIIQGFERSLHVTFRRGDVTGWEEERAAGLMALMKSLQIAENELGEMSARAD